MKYVAVVVIIIMFVRVDMILEFFDRISGNLEAPPQELLETDIPSKSPIIPLGEDRNLKQTPKATFFALLEDFHTSPNITIRERAMTILKNNPTMFGPNLDTGLESHIFRWRDLLINNDQEMVNFLHELSLVLTGQNLEMIKRYFALWMDINMDHFIAAYSRSKDVNCSIAGMFGDNIPEYEKLNEYYDREDALKAFLQKEAINATQKALATNCLMVLGLEISKIAPKQAPEEAPLLVPESAPLIPEAQPTTGVTP